MSMSGKRVNEIDSKKQSSSDWLKTVLEGEIFQAVLPYVQSYVAFGRPPSRATGQQTFITLQGSYLAALHMHAVD